jgi:epoxyqueuosine reductase QueG
MDRLNFQNILKDYINAAPGNYLKKEIALSPDLAGMRIFDEPLSGFADSEDEYFTRLKNPAAIGEHFMGPKEWLADAKTVISVFLPFTGQVRAANRRSMDWPANEWLHARIEGQAFMDEICRYLKGRIEAQGYTCAVPMLDPRFSRASPRGSDKKQQEYYTSNWSERHIAYTCGLGTFGLSKGLISSKGIAGRYLSLITGACIEPTKRTYSGLYDYCIRCGACARNCPVQAISLDRGKSHPICSAFVNRTMEKHKPRYGCGKCQVKVPCESRIPGT